MARIGVTGIPDPYHFFGTFAGLPFWGGGLTLLSAAPGIGKTSWMLRMLLNAAALGVPSALGCYEHTEDELKFRHLRMLLNAAALGVPSALGCYEHTEDELKFRLSKQAEAMVGGPHAGVNVTDVEDTLAQSANGILLALDDKKDTMRSLEEALLKLYGFPEKGNALVLVDYLNRIPVVGLTGVQPVETRS